MKLEAIQEARIQVGSCLFDVMKKNNLTKTLVAERANITREQLNYVLSGNRQYTIDTFFKVINALFMTYS